MEENSTKQVFTVEQPGYGAMRGEPEVQRVLGEGMVVAGCSYGGGRESGKTYRLWLSPATAAAFVPIHPASAESQCQACKSGVAHTQGFCPKQGSGQQRVKIQGMSVGEARNRVPPRLAEAVGRAMKEAFESESASGSSG